MTDNATSDAQFETETVDGHLSILADTGCRYVLYYFERVADDVASLSELAAFVAANAGSATAGTPERSAIRLHHQSLPRLADCDVLEYDASERTVRYHGSSDLEAFATVVGAKERGSA